MKLMLHALLFVWLILPVSASAIDDDELLRPEEAFLLTTETVEDGIELHWKIMEGYYLYKSKFRFEATQENVALDDAVYPKGKIKHDEFFGDMEIYRGEIVILLPVEESANLSSIEIDVTSQGCADAGICYPPYSKSISVRAPKHSGESRPAISSDKALSALKGLSNDLLENSSDSHEFLQPDDAFQLSTEIIDENTLLLRWDIAEHYYLYRNKFAIKGVDNTVSLGQAEFPVAEIKQDPLFGKVETYHNRVEVKVPYQTSTNSEFKLNIGYQGCAEAGICYPPIKKEVTLKSLAAPSKTLANDNKSVASNTEPALDAPEQDRLAAMLSGGNTWLTIATFFGLGLLLALTPCVFPMIPILSGIIAGQGEKMTTYKGFILSLTYVLAMSVTYTIAGYFAGVSGESLQVALQQPAVLIVFAAIFVILAISMFGFFEIQLPGALQSKLSEISNRQQGGSLIGVAIMGFLSALIVGPCLAPPLAGALIYIGQEGSGLLGATALFALSMGMGAPLILMGTLEGKFLPKAGGWMNAVKAIFGVLLLAVAIYLLDSVLPEGVILLLWATLILVSAVYMGALDPIKPSDNPLHEFNGWAKLYKGLGVVLFIYGLLIMVGAATGKGNLLQPLKGLSMGTAMSHAVAQEAHFKVFKGLDGFKQELVNAKGKVVMLDFYADWCVSCKEMEKFTFPDPAVQAKMSNMVLLQADVTDNDDLDKALMKHFGIIGPPSILFFNTQGEELPSRRLVGFMNAEKFSHHLDTVK